MKTYEVIIDFESEHLIIKAKSEQEAKEKGYDDWLKRQDLRPCWVGDCAEVEDD